MPTTTMTIRDRLTDYLAAAAIAEATGEPAPPLLEVARADALALTAADLHPDASILVDGVGVGVSQTGDLVLGEAVFFPFADLGGEAGAKEGYEDFEDAVRALVATGTAIELEPVETRSDAYLATYFLTVKTRHVGAALAEAAELRRTLLGIAGIEEIDR